ncbi:MAG: hypothetical protein MnENMB40S_12070 [Rhizobiaceae bacterium MnEN-MB40S]|nr:MAG: hypothetical protein MnENMB40S_12070 [Rhizobiaceae bacterium MnEN-MB40S]
MAAAAMLAVSGLANAADSPGGLKVTWESRWSEEAGNGDIVDHPPFVAVNDVRLYRFSEMQSVTYRDTLRIDHGDEGDERLYVFTVWQGGASQGEQLMLLSVRNDGVAVIGPHFMEFERLTIEMVNSESAPYFAFVSADGAILGAVDYVHGELIEADQ